MRSGEEGEKEQVEHKGEIKGRFPRMRWGRRWLGDEDRRGGGEERRRRKDEERWGTGGGGIWEEEKRLGGRRGRGEEGKQVEHIEEKRSRRGGAEDEGQIG